MKKTNKKGFTLAELLIVVAIIAVLVAIAIPVFTSQLEKAREATDAANLRAAYAEISAKILSEDNTVGNIDVEVTQKTAKWGNNTTIKIGNIDVEATKLTGWTVSATGDVVTIAEK